MTILDGLGDLIGIGGGSHDLNSGNMAVRAVIVYAFAILVLRLGDKRFLGKNTAFDVVLGVVFGSVLSRAITGNSDFVATLAAGLALIALHWLLAYTTIRTEGLGDLVKGVPRHLIKDGQPQTAVLRGSHITRADILQALRVGEGTEDLSIVESAYLERSGDISFIPKKSAPRVIEVHVEEGVQTVRIEWREAKS